MNTFKDVKFKKDNNDTIRGKFYYHYDGKSHPLVIFSHGFGGCYQDIEHHAQEFMDDGIGCLFYDFCGGGERSTSDGRFEDMTVLTEKEDLLTVFKRAREMPEVDKDNIFLLGESQGGLVSALVAAEVADDIKGMILWYPAFVIPDDAKKRLEGKDENGGDIFGVHISDEYNKVAASIDIDEVIRGYKGPVLLIHGDRDEIVPISYSEHAKELYNADKLIVVFGAGHGFNGEDSRYAGYNSRDFVIRHLR